MGRKPKFNAPQDLAAPVEDEQDFFDEVLADFDDEDGVEIEGKIYRKTKPEDSIGRMSFEAIAKVCEKVDEDWIGRHFGSGNYFIKWTFRKGDRKELRQKHYSIGSEYDKFIKDAAPVVSGSASKAAGLDLGGLLGSLTVDKVAAIAAAVKAVKDIFAPPPPPPTPQIDFVRLLEVLSNNNKPSVSEAIVIESLKSMKQQQERPQSSIAQQIADYNALKEIFEHGNNEDADEGGDMNFLIEQAFKYLPALLQKNNNNYQAVGQQVRENPVVMGIIQNNPDLAQTFFERAAHDYGPENAKALAAGFGYQMDFKAPQPQESEVVTNETN